MVRKKGRASETVLQEPLPEPLRAYLGPDGESVFRVAATKATPDEVKRLKSVTGPINAEFFVKLYKKRENPVWLWFILYAVKRQEDIPPDVFQYLQSAGKKIFLALFEEICSYEVVKMELGKEFDEAVSRGARRSPEPPDFLSILGLSRPSVNLLQAAARDLRDISVAAAVEHSARAHGESRDEARASLAKSLGRNSEEGPATAAIKKREARGRRLAALPDRRRKP